MSKKKGYSVYRAKRRDGKRENTFTVVFRDPTRPGGRGVIRGIASKAIGDEIGRAKVAQADRVKGGVISRQEVMATEAALLPLSKHVDAWRKAMKDRGRVEVHYETQTARVKRLAKLAGVRQLPDLAAERVQSALATVGRERSPQTARHYYVAIRAFVYFCIETGRVTVDPFPGLKRPTADGETFKRTPLPPEKLHDLLDSARTRRTTAHHKGTDRAMFYALLAYTGARSLGYVLAALDLEIRPRKR